MPKKDEVHWLYISLIGLFLFLAIILNVNSSIWGLPLGVIVLLIGISYFIMPPDWRKSIVFQRLKFNRKDLYWMGILITVLGFIIILWVLYLDYAK